jgi:hypothetical protein
LQIAILLQSFWRANFGIHNHSFHQIIIINCHFAPPIFNFKVDYLRSLSIGGGYLAVDEDRPLVRLGSSIDQFCNSITLKNFVHYVCKVPTFSVFLKQGLKDCLVPQTDRYEDFLQNDLFIEESVGRKRLLKLLQKSMLSLSSY